MGQAEGAREEAVTRPGAVIALTILVAGCNNDRVARLESEVQSIKQELSQVRKINGLELQAKCSGDAKTWFHENWQRDKDTNLLDYSAHYNAVSNKCFIEIYFNWSISAIRTTALHKSTTIHDIYENTEYGRLGQMSKIGEFSEPERITECVVYGSKCKTVEEYRVLAAKLMSQ
jgi:hypothetical protein